MRCVRWFVGKTSGCMRGVCLIDSAYAIREIN